MLSQSASQINPIQSNPQYSESVSPMPQAKSQEPRRHSLQGQKRIITAHITVIMSWRAFFTVVVLVVVLWRPHLAPNAAYEQFARSQSENASTFRNAKRSICWNLSSNATHPPPSLCHAHTSLLPTCWFSASLWNYAQIFFMQHREAEKSDAFAVNNTCSSSNTQIRPQSFT